VQKSGSYFSFGDERLGQGRQNANGVPEGASRRRAAILQGIQAQAPEGQVVSARLLPSSGEPTEVTPVDLEAEEVEEAEVEAATA
jgi:recA bacterial DNA recombination protein.